MDAIAQTDFVPNEVARSLFKKSARTIGLVIPSIRNPYFTQLASIIDEIANQNGYRLFLCNVGDDPEKERTAIQMLTAMNADGVIVTPVGEIIQGPAVIGEMGATVVVYPGHHAQVDAMQNIIM